MLWLCEIQLSALQKEKNKQHLPSTLLLIEKNVRLRCLEWLCHLAAASNLSLWLPGSKHGRVHNVSENILAREFLRGSGLSTFLHKRIKMFNADQH